jgi:hypothetical protein
MERRSKTFTSTVAKKDCRDSTRAERKDVDKPGQPLQSAHATQTESRRQHPISVVGKSFFSGIRLRSKRKAYTNRFGVKQRGRTLEKKGAESTTKKSS